MSAFTDAEFQAALVAAIPRMRGYARTLCRNLDQADDLVQEALLKGWEKRASLASAECLKPWLFTILRNAYLATRGRRSREVEDVDDVHALSMTVPPAQHSALDLAALMKALDQLPTTQREALVLVCVEGLDYAAAATVCGCAIGTLKSRINRGREQLARSLGLETSSPEMTGMLAIPQAA